MFRLSLIVVSWAVFTLGASGADKLPKPDRIPAPATPEQAALIREGVALHDQQDYAGAIAKYKQVLAENPWEVTALHELAFTYFASKDFEGALATARLGAQCRSRLLPLFYGMIGNALDELGRGGEAIETYRVAIKQSPDVGILHYNLAVSLRRTGKQVEAKAEVEKALQCDPGHASSHALLAAIYRDLGYRVPAIMAYSRFLILEPESPRSVQVLQTLLDLLTQGVGKGKNPNEITIFMADPSKAHKDEGDFGSVEMMMSILTAADIIKPSAEEAKLPPKSAFERVVARYSSMGEALENSKLKGGFAATYYAPYFAALAKAGHTEAFAAYALKGGQLEGSAEWAQANAEKVDGFLAWSKAYQWPGK